MKETFLASSLCAQPSRLRPSPRPHLASLHHLHPPHLPQKMTRRLMTIPLLIMPLQTSTPQFKAWTWVAMVIAMKAWMMKRIQTADSVLPVCEAHHPLQKQTRRHPHFALPLLLTPPRHLPQHQAWILKILALQARLLIPHQVNMPCANDILLTMGTAQSPPKKNRVSEDKRRQGCILDIRQM